MDYVPYFEDQIQIQEQAIRSFKRWMTGFVVLGLMVVAAAVVLTLESLGGIASPANIRATTGITSAIIIASVIRKI